MLVLGFFVAANSFNDKLLRNKYYHCKEAPTLFAILPPLDIICYLK